MLQKRSHYFCLRGLLQPPIISLSKRDVSSSVHLHTMHHDSAFQTERTAVCLIALETTAGVSMMMAPSKGTKIADSECYSNSKLEDTLRVSTTQNMSPSLHLTVDLWRGSHIGISSLCYGKARDECGRRDIPQDWTVPPFEALYAVDG